MLSRALLASLLSTVIAAHPSFEVVYEWNYIDYNWSSSDSLQETNIREEYVAENNAIAGIKLWKNKMYLTIPRWKNGVPVTLAVTSAKPLNDNVAPILDPYPNWEMQTEGDCNAFQFVQSMEIDPLGRMWVIDTGRTQTKNEEPITKCLPRLVILDLENNGTILRSYEFPNEVTPKESAYLNDIVLDHEDGGLAFITDTSRYDPGIIVYSLRDNESWKVRHDSMKAQEEATTFNVSGVTISSPIQVDGIALSPPGPNKLVYYSPVSSLHLYSIPVSVLKNRSLENVENHVIDLGLKQSQTDGMAMTNQGSLYLGFLKDDSVGMWESKKHPEFQTSVRPIRRDHDIMQWVDTFAIDENGRLWMVTNRLQNFMANRVNISLPNYRVIRSFTNAKNYQYFENGTAPELPKITGAADRINLTLANCLIIALVFLAR